MSAGLGTPVITFTSWPVSYADTVESVQLDTRIRVPVTTTPSKPPAPLAMTRGARSPGFHASTDLVGPNDTMMNRLGRPNRCSRGSRGIVRLARSEEHTSELQSQS